MKTESLTLVLPYCKTSDLRFYANLISIQLTAEIKLRSFTTLERELKRAIGWRDWREFDSAELPRTANPKSPYRASVSSQELMEKLARRQLNKRVEGLPASSMVELRYGLAGDFVAGELLQLKKNSLEEYYLLLATPKGHRHYSLNKAQRLSAPHPEAAAYLATLKNYGYPAITFTVHRYLFREMNFTVEITSPKAMPENALIVDRYARVRVR